MYRTYSRTRTLAPVPDHSLLAALSFLVILTLLLSALPHSIPVSLPSAAPAPEPVTAAPAVTPDFGRLPLSFVPNAGQSHPDVQFQVRGMGGAIFFTPNEIALSLPTGNTSRPMPDLASAEVPNAVSEYATVRLQFEDANPAPEIAGAEHLPGTHNYFIGSDPDQWETSIPTYAGVVYENLYDGIDLAYDGTQGTLKGTYTVAPHADPAQIRWNYAGADSVRIDAATGDLLVAIPGGKTLIEHAPIAWQTIDGQQVPVDAHFTVTGNGQVGFTLGDYDPMYALIIDPTLIYGTFLGGSEFDAAFQIAIDENGYVYLSGHTFSANFYHRSAYQEIYEGNGDIFVMKLSNDGQNILYSTFIGGSGFDTGWGDMAVNDSGHVFLAGNTTSVNFPTRSAHQKSYAGGDDGEFSGDAFALRLGATGDNLIYSTYLGGSGYDYAMAGVAIDSADNAYIGGRTASSDFPTRNAYRGTYSGGADGFVTKLNSTGDSLVFSTFLGGQDWDQVVGIAVDNSGSIYLTGNTASNNFPIRNAYQPNYIGNVDAFVTKMSDTGQSLIYSTYLGGSTGEDEGKEITFDGAGNAYITGLTYSTDFPTVNAYQTSFGGGGTDVFVASLNNTGQTLRFSTYLGGTGDEDGYDIVLSSTDAIYITGGTRSGNFPVVQAYQANYGGGNGDAFMTIFEPTGSSIRHSTYLGGSNYDKSYRLAVDSYGTAYIAGNTESPNFPVVNALQPSYEGVRDAFLVKIGDVVADMGFRPYPDGYSFENFSADFLPLTTDDYRDVFGDDAVCLFIIDDDCYMDPRARLFLAVDRSFRGDGGLCDGFASTSLSFFEDYPPSPSELVSGKEETFDLPDASDNQMVFRHIAKYFIKQGVNPVRSNNNRTKKLHPSEILANLRSAINGNDPVTLFIWYNSLSSKWVGHSVVPYAITEDVTNEGNYLVWVYDNNKPYQKDNPDNSLRYIEINTAIQQWSYNLEENPNRRGGVGTIGITPISLYNQQAECPWCVFKLSSGIPTGQVWFAGQGHLLLTNSQGQRMGYVGSELVNEIPEAYASIVHGGLDIAMEPSYTIPLSDNYTILIDGHTLTGADTSSVSQFGPGYAVSVDDIPINSDTRDHLEIASDGTHISYQASDAKDLSLTVATEDDSWVWQFQLQKVDIGTNRTVETAVDMSQGDLVFSNAQNDSGTYDLEINRANATGVYTFTHPAISVSAGDTHYLDYGAWDGSDTMTLNIDEGNDGSIDRTVILGQQEVSSIEVQSSAGQAGIPADGQSTTVISATVLDAGSNPIPNEPVTFSTTLGEVNSIRTATDENGIATTILTSGTISGTATITATAGDVSETVGVPFTTSTEPVRDLQLSVAAAHATLPADGQSTTVITATLLDSDTMPVSSEPVTFSTTLGSIMPITTTTDADGRATTILTTGTTPGTAAITVTAGGVQRRIDVVFEDSEPQETEKQVYLPLVVR